MAGITTTNTTPYYYEYSFEHLRFVFPGSVLGLVDIPVSLAQPLPLALGLGASVLYAAIVMLWPKTKPAPESGVFKSASFWHHAFLFAYSFFTCVAVFIYCFQRGELSSLTAMNCDPAPGWLVLLALSFTASKIWEWGDTFIFLARGQTTAKIGFLHLYHHCTTFWCCLIVSTFPGSLKCGMLLNGGVHTLMYAHYAWRFPKPLRPLITIAQIAQLAFLTWQWHITPSICPAYAAYPAAHPVEFALPYLMVPVYLIFFLKFFTETFIFPKKKGAPSKEE